MQLSRGIFRSGHLFNLDAGELGRLVLAPLAAGRPIEVEGKTWPPFETRVAIYEGPALTPDQLALGQGWRNAGRAGADVTASWLGTADAAGEPQSAAPDARSVAVLGAASNADLERLGGFLRALGLEPAFPAPQAAAGGAAALVADALAAHGALVLLLGGGVDERHRSRVLTPDVLVAAGLAAGAGGPRAVIAALGEIPGDVPLAALGAVRLDGGGEGPLRELAARLRRAGAAVEPAGEGWLDPARFAR